MARYEEYATKEEHLHKNDKMLLNKYRAFNERLRRNSQNPFQPHQTIREHQQHLECNSISLTTEKELINELLRFHGWACIDVGREEYPQEISLHDLIFSYEDLYRFGVWLTSTRKTMVRTTQRVVQAVISILKFLKAEGSEDENVVNQAWDQAKKLLAKIARSSENTYDRPSLCQMRKEGKALSYTDLVFVLKQQKKRVRYLIERKGEHGSRYEFLNKQLKVEYERLLVLQTLLKFPVRKSEASKIVVEGIRLKLRADDRKNRKNPINIELSSSEQEIFQSWYELTALRSWQDNMTWRPFEGVDTTAVLKAVTQGIVGVPITSSILRTAVESYVEDLEDREDIRDAVHHAEGHTSDIAYRHYKRQSSEVTMKGWTNHVQPMIEHLPQTKGSKDEVWLKLCSAATVSYKRWLSMFTDQMNKQTSLAKRDATPKVRSKRTTWLKEEDDELRNCMKKFRGSHFIWKDILDNSELLQRRFCGRDLLLSRAALKDRYRVLMKKSIKSSTTSLVIHPQVQKSRKPWSSDEDQELLDLESDFSSSKSKWKDILEHSELLQSRYSDTKVELARAALKDRFRVLKKKGNSAKQKVFCRTVIKSNSVKKSKTSSSDDNSSSFSSCSEFDFNE